MRACTRGSVVRSSQISGGGGDNFFRNLARPLSSAYTRCGPDEGLGRLVMRLDVARDGVFEFGNGFEDAAPDSSARDRREKPFDGVEPGGGRRGEVVGPSWMRGEPFQDIGMFVRGVIVDDGVNELAAWHGAVHRVEKSDELLMPLLVHATPDHGSVED